MPAERVAQAIEIMEKINAKQCAAPNSGRRRGVDRRGKGRAGSAVHDRLFDHAMDALGAVDGLGHPQIGGEAA